MNSIISIETLKGLNNERLRAYNKGLNNIVRKHDVYLEVYSKLIELAKNGLVSLNDKDMENFTKLVYYKNKIVFEILEEKALL